LHDLPVRLHKVNHKENHIAKEKQIDVDGGDSSDQMMMMTTTTTTTEDKFEQ